MDRPDPAQDPTAEGLLARLAEGEGARLLASLPAPEPGDALSLGTRLRREGYDVALVAAALTQRELRASARARLGDAVDGMLLTRDGVEQATRPAVAARRAARLAASGVEHVWDLGCGLGLDARALAEAGLAVTAVERDPEVAAAAKANLAPYPRARVVVGDVADHRPGPEDGAVLDPARRTPGVADARGRTRRLVRLEDLSPSWELVQEVAAGCAATGAKLSPGFPHAHLPAGTEAEWVSLDGAVLECAIWWRAVVRSPGRRAVVGTTQGDGTVGWVEVDAPAGPAPDPLGPGEPLGSWLAEPDRAVLAAGRVDALCALADARELDPGVGYVTATTPIPLPWARWYAVREVLPLRAKVVRGWLRERGLARVTLKKRGTAVDPDRFRQELRLRPGKDGDGEAVLVLTRAGGCPVAVVVEPWVAPA